jgi:GntR family transcriptional regulator, transcriptional repressor for pyruvate dehydrogenase complex
VPDHVFAHLREAIIGGRYPPGERLPSQRALAADLDVNLACVREALGRLEQLRLVEVRHGEPTLVRDWRRAGGLEALVLRPDADPVLLGDIFEARRLLLADAARLAAERRTEEHVEQLSALARAIADAGEDRTALLADWEFMATLVEAAGNLVFQLTMNSVRELYLPHVDAFSGLVANRSRLSGSYARVVDAVQCRDGDRALAAMEELADAQRASVAR